MLTDALPRSFNASSVPIKLRIGYILLRHFQDDVYTDIPAQLLRDRDGFALAATPACPTGFIPTCVRRYQSDGTCDMAYGRGTKFSVGVGGITDLPFGSGCSKMEKCHWHSATQGRADDAGDALAADGAPWTMTFGLAGPPRMEPSQADSFAVPGLAIAVRRARGGVPLAAVIRYHLAFAQ